MIILHYKNSSFIIQASSITEASVYEPIMSINIPVIKMDTAKWCLIVSTLIPLIVYFAVHLVWLLDPNSVCVVITPDTCASL